ncbi:MAG: phosphoribosyl-ATP diphosphatase [Neomegalonema sp.]|nr:phosphoribosyl-ATP diphosphatase [Neomegalonema sp.]
MSDILTRLEATIAERKAAGDAAGSHTARLLARGPAKCAQKFGEEAVETVIALVSGDRDEVASEAADALYHLLVALAARDMTLADALAVLESREGVSGVAEKAARAE